MLVIVPALETSVALVPALFTNSGRALADKLHAISMSSANSVFEKNFVISDNFWGFIVNNRIFPDEFPVWVAFLRRPARFWGKYSTFFKKLQTNCLI
ncbi:MAG: hypothetical protein HUK11_02235 [Muribaculaceae bacterium]|nr:hypothetical protein [Muribaculaceae bacterium]